MNDNHMKVMVLNTHGEKEGDEESIRRGHTKDTSITLTDYPLSHDTHQNTLHPPILIRLLWLSRRGFSFRLVSVDLYLLACG